MIGSAEIRLGTRSAHAGIRFQELAPEAAFAAACLLSIGFRFWILSKAHAPPGIDPGNWLALGKGLMGETIGSSSVAYPPVVPLLVTWSAAVLGVTAGVASVGALSAAAPAIGTFLVLRWTDVDRRIGLALALLMLWAPGVGEATAWGGYPQLLAAPFLVAWLWHLDAWLHDGRRADLGVGAIGCMCTFAISHFVVAIGLLAAVVTVVVRRLDDSTRGGGSGRRTMIAAVSTILAAVPFFGIYFRVGTEYLTAYWDSVDVTRLDLIEIPQRLAHIYGPSWPFWTFLFAAAIAVPFFARHRFRTRLFIVSSSLAAATLGLFILTGEPRLIHALELALPLLLAVWLVRSDHRPRWVRATVVGVLVCASVGGVAQFSGQRERYSVLDRGLLGAIEWIAENTDEDAVIAVGPAGDAPLGWWVEGLAERESVYAAPLRWLYESDERQRAAVANEMFLFDTLDSATSSAARDRLGVDYILLAKDPTTSELLDSPERTLRVVFETTSAVVLTDLDGGGTG